MATEVASRIVEFPVICEVAEINTEARQRLTSTLLAVASFDLRITADTQPPSGK